MRLEYKIDLTATIKIEIVKALIKHVAYARGHINVAYSDLELLGSEYQQLTSNKRENDSKKKKKKLSTGAGKKAYKILEQFSNVFSAVEAVLRSDEPPECIALVFGPSVFTYKELYAITFPYSFQNPTKVCHVNHKTPPVCQEHICAPPPLEPRGDLHLQRPPPDGGAPAAAAPGGEEEEEAGVPPAAGPRGAGPQPPPHGGVVDMELGSPPPPPPRQPRTALSPFEDDNLSKDKDQAELLKVAISSWNKEENDLTPLLTQPPIQNTLLSCDQEIRRPEITENIGQQMNSHPILMAASTVQGSQKEGAWPPPLAALNACQSCGVRPDNKNNDNNKISMATTRKEQKQAEQLRLAKKCVRKLVRELVMLAINNEDPKEVGDQQAHGGGDQPRLAPPPGPLARTRAVPATRLHALAWRRQRRRPLAVPCHGRRPAGTGAGTGAGAPSLMAGGEVAAGGACCCVGGGDPAAGSGDEVAEGEQQERERLHWKGWAPCSRFKVKEGGRKKKGKGGGKKTAAATTNRKPRRVDEGTSSMQFIHLLSREKKGQQQEEVEGEQAGGGGGGCKPTSSDHTYNHGTNYLFKNYQYDRPALIFESGTWYKLKTKVNNLKIK